MLYLRLLKPPRPFLPPSPSKSLMVWLVPCEGGVNVRQCLPLSLFELQSLLQGIFGAPHFVLSNTENEQLIIFSAKLIAASQTDMKILFLVCLIFGYETSIAMFEQLGPRVSNTFEIP